jgi:NADPH-dependent curcumin reductase
LQAARFQRNHHPIKEMIMDYENHVWRLMQRPVGDIADGDLVYSKEPVPALNDGEYLVEVIYLSLDPTNRIWMSDQEQYMPPVALGAIMRGGVVGRVVESRRPDVKVGDIRTGLGGFAKYIVASKANPMLSMPPIPGVPLSTAFGSLFLTGPTAYFGLLDIGEPKPGDTLVVSAAAGAVGSVVCQIGKIKDCRVIGIAGSQEKCNWLVNDLGIDGAINYKSEDVGQRLDVLCPKGIDINFEQVGGEIMEAVMARMNNHSRMPLCGMISGYNDTALAPGPRAWPLILMHRIKVQGFIMTDYMPRFAEATMQLAQWMLEGKLKTKVDVRQGLETAIDSLRDLYTGANNGKLLVQVSPE